MAEENPVAKAMAESATTIAIARAETRKRNKWTYIRKADLHEWAKREGKEGSDEVLMREYFREPLMRAAIQRLPVDRQRDLLAKGGIPENFNPDGKVEEGKDANDVEFLALWSAKGEPEFPPTF